MFTYHCLNPISEKGLQNFDTNYEETENLDADALLVRSADMLSMEIPAKVKAIARAGAGVNNIPLKTCSERGIVVFNTPGANANGVKELVIAGMLLASRDIVGGIEWIEHQEDMSDIQKRAEKEKKHFAGTEISGKKLGIIGLGAIGVLVANAAVHLGMDVYGYDPYISVNAAWNMSRSIHHSRDINEIYHDCDYITLHVPATEETMGMINRSTIARMKDGVVLLNFARDLLIDEVAVVEALEAGKFRKYVTDFATPAIAKAKNTLVTPHLGASTEESEENCAVMAVQQVRDYLENGNIHNSVNFANCELGKCQSAGRITVSHLNKPNMLAYMTAKVGGLGINIADFTSKSKGDYAYTIMDIGAKPSKALLDAIYEIDGVIKVRTIHRTRTV
ncbi:MAG: 3-phosphoglycerate dehydrogenase [Lachnospiraceae bacterium]|nr:3-phosphoglycerate dehydrogenase [Lachnospiraceae bacterium]